MTPLRGLERSGAPSVPKRREEARMVASQPRKPYGVRRKGGAEALALLPDLEHDLATCVSARDPSQRLANPAQRQDRFDLRA